MNLFIEFKPYKKEANLPKLTEEGFDYIILLTIWRHAILKHMERIICLSSLFELKDYNFLLQKDIS